MDDPFSAHNVSESMHILSAEDQLTRMASHKLRPWGLLERHACSCHLSPLAMKYWALRHSNDADGPGGHFPDAMLMVVCTVVCL